MPELITLGEFIFDRQKEFKDATGDLSAVLRDISVAAKIVNRVVNRAGLLDIIGNSESENKSGDAQQKLDVFANKWFKRMMMSSEECCGFASEEEEDFVAFETETGKNAKYLVIFDPLDGSSNIDVNVSIGTIFSVFHRKSGFGSTCTESDFLQAGDEQVAAGYVLYGTSTMMVYTTGNGVNGFTLYPSIGEFCLSHANIRIPDKMPNYSINQGYYEIMTEHVRSFIEKRKAENKSLRFVGSMVADVHRTLLKGGIFIYPTLKTHPKGKLRLLYECNPMAMLMEQAGGKAIDEHGKRILEIQPEELHERSSIAIGAASAVDEFKHG
ncbi:MAG TPA: class 1 fructose-bisphosphatase [Saprospiraceae bacterium]|nr:class 1 fructose-bisphosphatase [Saprospiraceae bacterium]